MGRGGAENGIGNETSNALNPSWPWLARPKLMKNLEREPLDQLAAALQAMRSQRPQPATKRKRIKELIRAVVMKSGLNACQ